MAILSAVLSRYKRTFGFKVTNIRLFFSGLALQSLTGDLL